MLSKWNVMWTMQTSSLISCIKETDKCKCKCVSLHLAVCRQSKSGEMTSLYHCYHQLLWLLLVSTHEHQWCTPQRHYFHLAECLPTLNVDELQTMIIQTTHELKKTKSRSRFHYSQWLHQATYFAALVSSNQRFQHTLIKRQEQTRYRSLRKTSPVKKLAKKIK